MPRHLVIVESATKARTLGHLLPGPDFLVRAWPGPVRELPSDRLAVDAARGFAAEYRVVPARRGLLAGLRQTAREVETVYLAADPDREGEAFCWQLAEELAPATRRGSVRRLVLHELSEPAVRAALSAPRGLDPRLVDAQQARQLRDHLFAHGLARLPHEAGRGRVAGCTQAVALQLVCDREREIEAFVARERWTLRARLDTGDALLGVRLVQASGRQPRRIGAAEAELLRRELGTATFRVANVVERQLVRSAPPPLVTSTLLGEASRTLGFEPGKTLRLAQRLYDGVELGSEGPVGLITCIRTATTRVAAEACEAARRHVARTRSVEQASESDPGARRSGNGGLEAIRPTRPERAPESLARLLAADELALYRLVFDRFLISQMSPAVYDTTLVEVLAQPTGGSSTHRLTAEAVVPRVAGFLAAQRAQREGGPPGRADETGPEPGVPLPRLTSGQALALREVLLEPWPSEPPQRFTLASLTSELERRGCAQPAVDRALLTTLTSGDCFRTQRRRVQPTQPGLALNAALQRCWPDLVGAQQAAWLESSLDAIAEGRDTLLGVLGRFWRDLESALRTGRQGPRPRADKGPREPAPIVTAGASSGRCPLCGSSLTRRSGRYGMLVGCSRYPACRHLERKRVRQVGVSCPRCQRGQVVEREAEGRVFYGCSLYPACRFTSRHRPLPESCPACGRAYLLEKTTRRDGRVVFCDYQGCRFRRTNAGDASCGS